MNAFVLHPYTTQLQAGLGLVSETKILLALWTAGMPVAKLCQIALASGEFPTVTARRLRNIVVECFAPRYLVDDGAPAKLLQRLIPVLAPAELQQLMLLYTARANRVLGDFVTSVYWPAYAAGASALDTVVARGFVQRCVDDGLTRRRWSETTVCRIAGYLASCCADYGLLESGSRRTRRILTMRTSPILVAILAHDLHFRGVADNALLIHPDWTLFGLDREDVLGEMRRLSLQNIWLVQAAGDSVRIGWHHSHMESVCDDLTQG